MTNLSGFDLNLLRVLDVLLRERSTVRTGRIVGLSQPAVSAALGKLRRGLGDPLFLRQGQGMVPTSFALSLELPLRTALEALDMAVRPRGFDPAEAAFDFRLSGTDYHAVVLIPPLAARVQEQAPGVRVQLSNLSPENYLQSLERAQVDLALTPEQHFPPWLERVPLFRPEFVVILRHGHPVLAGVGWEPGGVLPLDAFCACDHALCSPEGRFEGPGDVALARAGRSRRVVLSLPYFEGVFQAVAGTDLIALVPSVLAHRRAAAMGLVVLAPPVALRGPMICMAWHRRRTGDPGHRWLRGLVAELLRDPTGAAAAPWHPRPACPRP